MSFTDAEDLESRSCSSYRSACRLPLLAPPALPGKPVEAWHELSAKDSSCCCSFESLSKDDLEWAFELMDGTCICTKMSKR